MLTPNSPIFLRQQSLRTSPCLPTPRLFQELGTLSPNRNHPIQEETSDGATPASSPLDFSTSPSSPPAGQNLPIVDWSPVSPPVSPQRKKPCPDRSKSNNPNPGYRLNVKSTFLTFPRCEMTKADALRRLVAGSRFQPLWAVIAQEKHSDGAHHLHLLVEWTKKINIRDATALDYITNQHGSYEKTRALPSALKYLYKEDPEPLLYGPVPTDLLSTPSGRTAPPKKEKIGDKVAAALIQGQSILSQIQEEPGYVMNNLKKMQQFSTFLVSQKEKRMSSTHQIRIMVGEDPTAQDATIFSWLRDCLFDRRRAFKAPQLYVHGPPNSNKTSLILKLNQVAKYYGMPNDESFDDLWDDNVYDFAVLDEYAKGQARTPQQLNRFADGSPVTLRVKGSQVIKAFRCPMIILSNFSPAECIPDHNSLQAFLSRFTVVQLEQPIDLTKISFEILTKEGTPCSCDQHSSDPTPL